MFRNKEGICMDSIHTQIHILCLKVSLRNSYVLIDKIRNVLGSRSYAIGLQQYNVDFIFSEKCKL